MANDPIYVPRLEGRVALVQDKEGLLRLQVDRPRRLEARLVTREPRAAIFLTQTFAADSGISHALAAASATENALGLSLPPNGFTARDLLHALSLLHAHVRHFYFQVLPDYLPASALAEYNGNDMRLARVAAELAGEDAPPWLQSQFKSRFLRSEANALVEHMQAALQVLNTLQAMMAQLGGKYPVTMSIIPGGMSIRLGEAEILQLERRIVAVMGFLTEEVSHDMAQVLQKFPEIASLGRGLTEYLSGGSLGADTGGDAALFPAGAYIGERLVPFAGGITETIAQSRYRLRRAGDGRAPVLEEIDDLGAAGSWIKSPRVQNRLVDVGPLARTVIAHMTAASSRQAELVADIETRIGVPVQQANTVGGRLLARVGELALLANRSYENIQRLQPGQAFWEPASEGNPEAVQAAAAIEGPAGTLWHRMALRRGRISLYDIVSAATWQGAPGAPDGPTGSIEVALNAASLTLSREGDKVTASRILHSFAFSATDAVQ